MVTRHEFLTTLHETLKPRGYLEVGVQFGTSLALAKCPAIGIDPNPILMGHFPGTISVYTKTSDEFFSDPAVMEWWGVPVDLAFIDGMHLFEYALRDFMNIEKYANERTVVVFDDVLPRNQHEAARDQCPGDWTGDVWKVPRILRLMRTDLKVLLVNTQPTGTAVVYNLNPASKRLAQMYEGMAAWGLSEWQTVPEEVINRDEAVDPDYALEQVTAHLLTLEDK